MIEEDQLLDISTHCAHFNLKKATRAATKLYDEALASTGLGISQFTLLVASALAGPQSISDLAEYLRNGPEYFEPKRATSRKTGSA